MRLVNSFRAVLTYCLLVASRLESTGQKGQVQISKDTVYLITAAGKSHRITPRKELVAAKGKGGMQSFWLVMQGGVNGTGGPNEKRSSFTSSAIVWGLLSAPCCSNLRA